MTGILMASVGNSYGSAPVNTVAPVVSGTATVGQTLSTTNGTWTGAPAPTFTYQWQRTGVDIGGATSSTYVLVAADYANTIRCVVRATNSVAPAGVTANSNSTASVAGNAPVNTVAPAVTGTATFGQTLSSTTGTWTGVPTPTFTYQWQRVTTNISGATSSTYVLVQADVGSTIRCVVTATNAVSAVSANSNSTATVAATVPGAPTIGTATATSSSTATVAYTAPASNGGATITLYTATSSPGGLTGTLATAGSGTITVSGLTASTSYTFTVKATNSVGQSAASAASNSITTSAASYWSTIKTSSNATAASQATIDSSGNTYQIFTNGGSGGALAMAKTSTAVASVFSQQYPSQNMTRELSTMSCVNGSTILLSGFNSYPNIIQYNTSGTEVYNRLYRIIGSSFSEWITKSTQITGDGSIIIGVRARLPVGKSVYTNGYAVKWNSSFGNVYLWQLTQSSNAAIVDVAVYEVGGNLCLYGQSNSGYGGVHPVNSSTGVGGTGTRVKGGATANLDFVVMNGYYDTVNSSHYVIGYTQGLGQDTFMMAKFNSSFTCNWIVTLASGSQHIPKNLVFDTSGNIYVVGYYYDGSGYAISLVKYNSSGTLQWQRRLTIAGYENAYSYSFGIQGTSLILSGAINNGGNRCGFSITYPTDGSITGSYTNNGFSMTIAATTFTAASQTINTVATSYSIYSALTYTLVDTQTYAAAALTGTNTQTYTTL